jgi:hypothetical protein
MSRMAARMMRIRQKIKSFILSILAVILDIL